jgi:hypothetical protein
MIREESGRDIGRDVRLGLRVDGDKLDGASEDAAPCVANVHGELCAVRGGQVEARLGAGHVVDGAYDDRLALRLDRPVGGTADEWDDGEDEDGESHVVALLGRTCAGYAPAARDR